MHRIRSGTSELKQFERFQAARHLIAEEMDTYLDARLSPEDSQEVMTVDVCGVKDKRLTVVFCQTGQHEPLSETIAAIDKSRNAKAIVMMPNDLAHATVDQKLREAIENGKASLEILGWFNDSLEETFRETLDLIDLLGNETRIRMLAPLLEKSGAKKDYRTRINPKLVYHNISALSSAGLLDETNEGAYELSQFGKTILAEFITFLEKTRKALDETKVKEVKDD